MIVSRVTNMHASPVNVIASGDTYSVGPGSSLAAAFSPDELAAARQALGVDDASTQGVADLQWASDWQAAADAAASVPAGLLPLQPYQFFAMLELSGKKPALDAFIAALPSPQNVIAKAKLDRSLAFHRDNDLVLAAQSALSLTDQQLDALWLQASAL